MSGSEKVVPDWVWKRRWSRSWSRNTTIVYGLFIGSLGLTILIAALFVQIRLNSTCTGYTICVLLGPVSDSLQWLNLVIIPLADGLTVAGFLYAFLTWRVKEWEWAATFGLQPFAKRLELMYSQGEISRQQVDEILAALTSPTKLT